MIKSNFINTVYNGITSFAINFKNVNDAEHIAIVEESKKLIVSVGMKTKTTVEVDFQVGQTLNSVNFKSSKFKTHESVRRNLFTNTESKSNRFKITKKQGINELLEYIDEMINLVYKNSNLTELDVNIDFSLSMPFSKNEIQNAIELHNSKN